MSGKPKTHKELNDEVYPKILEHRDRLCTSCGVNYADPPSRLCPGCQAYQEHIWSIL